MHVPCRTSVSPRIKLDEPFERLASLSALKRFKFNNVLTIIIW